VLHAVICKSEVTLTEKYAPMKWAETHAKQDLKPLITKLQLNVPSYFVSNNPHFIQITYVKL
jgi:hypothetical protein